MKKLLATLTIAAGLAGCGYHPSSGTVVGRQYNPPYTHTDQNCSMYSSSTPGLCMVYSYNTVTDPAEWYLTLRHCKSYEPYPKNCKTGSRQVGELEYNKYSKGEFYP